MFTKQRNRFRQICLSLAATIVAGLCVVISGGSPLSVGSLSVGSLTNPGGSLGVAPQQPTPQSSWKIADRAAPTRDMARAAQRFQQTQKRFSPTELERQIRDLFQINLQSLGTPSDGSAVRLVAFPSDGDSETADEKATEAQATSEDTAEPKSANVATPKATGKFDEEISLDEIDQAEDASLEPSASDWENAEIVPTPIAEREITAEVVPTPLGMPEQALAELQSARKPPISLRTRSDVVAIAPIAPGSLPVTPIKNSMGSPASPADSIRPEGTIRMAADRRVASPSSTQPLSEGPALSDDLAKVLPDGLVAADANTIANNALGNLAGGPVDYKSWPKPTVALFVTGQQHGYIEPCGCTGLDKQKGGVARRMTFANQLRNQGWELLPIDAGNLIRRFGRQAEIKFHRSFEALRKMGYVAVGFGPDDVRINVGDLIQEAAPEKVEDMIYASANVVLIDPSLMPSYQMIEREGMKVAVTSILDPASLETSLSEDIILNDPVASAQEVIGQIQAEQPDFTVLTFYGEDEAAREVVRKVPGFDLVVVAGGYGEPTYQPDDVDGSSTKMILTGNKGMYAGLVALYDDEPMKYARVPLTHEFEDAPEMRKLMADYQFQLRDLGLANLGLKPIPHPSGREFVGSKTCGECHTNAYDIWEGSAHFEATEHLVHPGERGDVPRHFDPECISCHVTGWNPQNYYPYATGYLDLEADSHLHGNGCENCHGPGAAHSAAESGDDSVSEAVRDQLREAMKLPLSEAREKCMECHDLDNSPDFHEEDAFDDYWAEVEHYGLD